MNKQFAGPDATFTKVERVGARATYAAGSALSGMIVGTDDGRVLTVFAPDLPRKAAVEIAKSAAKHLS